jgi:hypothetical protein
MSERTLTQLYAERHQGGEKPIVLFLPGIMGSVMEEASTGRVLWGGGRSGSLDQLALPIDSPSLLENRDTLRPRRLLQRFSLLGGLKYSDIYATTARIGIAAGCVPGNIQNPQPGQTGFAFPYDWRRDLVEAAQALGAAIERLKTGLGKPDLKVALLCHSTGGLIARYYAKYGTEDVLDQDPLPPPTYAGAKNISRIVMLGTPNAGSLDMFYRMHQGRWIPTVGTWTPETIFTMPAAYQLLPFDGREVFVDADGRPLDVDLYDPENWERYGWAAFQPRRQATVRTRMVRRDPGEGAARHEELRERQRRFLVAALRRAERFHLALRHGNPAEESERIRWRTRFESRDPATKQQLYAYGDLSVTKESLLGQRRFGPAGSGPSRRLPGAQAMFFCEGHGGLPRSITFMDNVLNTLLDE